MTPESNQNQQEVFNQENRPPGCTNQENRPPDWSGWYQYAYQYPQMVYAPPAPRIKKEKRVVSIAERLLLIAALAVSVLFDRLLVDRLFTSGYPKFYSAFWLCFITVFYCFFWKKIKHNYITWYLTACVSALCVWSYIFWDTAAYLEYGHITFLIIPVVLMGLIVYMTGDYKLKETGSIAVAWLSGFFVWPFSKISALFEAVGALLTGETKTKTKKAMLGIAISCGLLVIILPLLSNADRAFGYHLMQIITNFNLSSLFLHAIVITVAFMFFYSFMWKTGIGERKKHCPKITAKIDTTICCVILGSIILLYTMFCTVQFTYLFAGAGLPGQMTYSEYAREGFSQTVVVCALNLFIFGIFMHFGTKNKVSTGLLLGLLVLTAVMLFSGFIRLGLYIDAYGMTWLRLLSAWFIIYLAAVIILCGLRLKLSKLPLIASCTLILVGWYIMLGYVLIPVGAFPG